MFEFIKFAVLFVACLILPLQSWAAQQTGRQLTEQQLAEVQHTVTETIARLEQQFEQANEGGWASISSHERRTLAKTESSATPLMDDAAAFIMRGIEQSVDPVLREALLDQWLDRQLHKAGNSALEIMLIESLIDEPQHTLIPHHDISSHVIPAFNIGRRASNLLALRERQNEAWKLARDTDALITAFDSPINSETFKAAELAAQSIQADTQKRLIEHFQARILEQPEAANALIALVDHSLNHSDVLASIIEHGDLASARQILRSLEPIPSNWSLAELALQRPALGGLAVQAWVDTGGDVDQRLWAMLGDSDLGADAARALAEHSTQLISTIEAHIHSAEPLVRLRMLLALKLRNTADSHQTLENLLEADWLTEQQRSEVASWL